MIATLALAASVASASNGWKSETSILLPETAFVSATWGPKPIGEYLSAEFAYAPFEASRIEVESRLGTTLKNRGEAHVTLISPPELKSLTKVLSPKEVRDLVSKTLDLSKLEVKPICVGVGSLAAEKTWFIVIEVPAAQRARRAVETLFLKKGGEKTAFIADEFYPHVTLGFTKRDLHSQDGVVKNVTSCKYPIRR